MDDRVQVSERGKGRETGHFDIIYRECRSEVSRVTGPMLVTALASRVGPLPGEVTRGQSWGRRH